MNLDPVYVGVLLYFFSLCCGRSILFFCLVLWLWNSDLRFGLDFLVSIIVSRMYWEKIVRIFRRMKRGLQCSRLGFLHIVLSACFCSMSIFSIFALGADPHAEIP